MSVKEQWYCRLVGGTSGILMATANIYPVAAPLQAIALAGVLYWAVTARAGHRAMLVVGLYMGLAYTLPQMIALRLPPLMAGVLIVNLTIVMVVFAWGSAQLMKKSAIAGSFAVGALLAVLDWANFTAIPVWGSAQSLGRCWSQYPGLVGFVSLTGITGIIFVLAVLSALVVRLITKTGPRVKVLTAILAVVLIVATANLVVRARAPIATIKVAAVGWTSADETEYSDFNSRDRFEALLAGPAEKAARLGARLIVSPEMGFYSQFADREQWFEQFRRVARGGNVFLAIGYVNAIEQENRLLFMNPEGDVLSEYTKTHLTPFEGFRKGSGLLQMMDVDGVRVGGMICQDDNFTELSRWYGRKRTGVVVVPTLDWRPVRNAHLQSSIHRAIESRYAIVRASQNGISAIISPMGKVLARMDHFTEGPGTIVADVPIYEHQSLFSRIGHWPVAISSVFLVIFVGGSLVSRYSRRRLERDKQGQGVEQ